MDLAWWPGPAVHAGDIEDITHLFKGVAAAYEEAGKQIIRTLSGAIKVQKITQKDVVLFPGTHDSPPAIDINVTGRFKDERH